MGLAGLSVAEAEAREAVVVRAIALAAGIDENDPRVEVVVTFSQTPRRRLQEGVVATYYVASDDADAEGLMNALDDISPTDFDAALQTAAAAEGEAAFFAAVETTDVSDTASWAATPAPAPDDVYAVGEAVDDDALCGDGGCGSKGSSSGGSDVDAAAAVGAAIAAGGLLMVCAVVRLSWRRDTIKGAAPGAAVATRAEEVPRETELVVAEPPSQKDDYI